MHTSTQWATHLQFTPIVATNSLLLALLAQFEVSTTFRNGGGPQKEAAQKICCFFVVPVILSCLSAEPRHKEKQASKTLA